MIQRIQTIYLLASCILIAFMIDMPMLQLAGTNGGIFLFKSYGVISIGDDTVNIYNTWPLLIMFIAIASISLFTIFLYKNRQLQIRLTIYNMILQVGLTGVIYFFYISFNKEMSIDHISYEISLAFPVIALIFNYLALRNIRKDEAIIQSMNRLR
ncbi:MAG: DUF4293 family protein [Bacteroidetes bacterium]|jgi:hypothetical protein|nr:DUF4293 family protein [Bacteroidota bacterium]